MYTGTAVIRSLDGPHYRPSPRRSWSCLGHAASILQYCISHTLSLTVSSVYSNPNRSLTSHVQDTAAHWTLLAHTSYHGTHTSQEVTRQSLYTTILDSNPSTTLCTVPSHWVPRTVFALRLTSYIPLESRIYSIVSYDVFFSCAV